MVEIKKFYLKLYSSSAVVIFRYYNETNNIVSHKTNRFVTSGLCGPLCLSCTFMEIWHLKDNGDTTLTFLGYVTSSVTWSFDSRWATSYGWSIVTMHVSGTVMKPQTLDARTDARTHGRSGDFILCPMLCIALDRQKSSLVKMFSRAKVTGMLVFSSEGQSLELKHFPVGRPHNM